MDSHHCIQCNVPPLLHTAKKHVIKQKSHFSPCSLVNVMVVCPQLSHRGDQTPNCTSHLPGMSIEIPLGYSFMHSCVLNTVVKPSMQRKITGKDGEGQEKL